MNSSYQGRNLKVFTGGARPGTGGHSLLNKDFAKNFEKCIKNCHKNLEFLGNVLVTFKQNLRQSNQFLLIFNLFLKITTD